MKGALPLPFRVVAFPVGRFFLVLDELRPVLCDGAIPAYSEPATSPANYMRGLSCCAGGLERPTKGTAGGGEVGREGGKRQWGVGRRR